MAHMIFGDLAMQEANKENVKPSSQRSLVESPPALSESTPEKSVKNFSTRYLGTGMWPSKQAGRRPPSESVILTQAQRPDRRQFVS